MEEILRSIPQRPPFLFLDEIVERGDRSVHCRKLVTGTEDFFKGHFPGNPIMPGVLLQEAAFQAGALLIGNDKTGLGVVTKVENARFKNFVRPGDLMEIKVELLEIIGNAFYMKGRISVSNKLVLQLSFTCMAISS